MAKTILRTGLVLALLLVTSGAGRADEAPQARLWAPWEAEFQKARRLMADEDHEEAREVFRGILEQYPDLEIQDRAISGMASSYLAERRYARAIRYLEGAIEEHASLLRSRTLYSAVEERVGRALARARVRERQAREEYEDLSWWNIFRIFDKLGRRRDLKDAERDVEELQELRNLFRPELLLPLPLRRPADPPLRIMDTASSASSAATTGSATAASTSGASTVLAKASELASSAPGSDAVSGPAEAVTEAATEGAAPASPASTGSATATEEASVASTSGTEDGKAEAFRVLADEIDALLVLIPADRIAAAELILQGRVASASLSTLSTPMASTEAATATEATTSSPPEVLPEPGSQPVSESTSAPAPTEDPDAAVVETVAPAAPSDPSTAPAEATVTTTAPVEPPAPVTSGSLREAYFAAYRDLQAALQTSDSAAIQQAREAYMAALAAMRGAQWGIVQGSSQGPAAPGSPQVVEPVVRSPVPSTGHQAGRGTFQQDRLGVFRGTGDGALGSSRGSFQR